MGGRKRQFSLDDYAHERGEDLHRCGAYANPFVIADLGNGIITVSATLWFGKELQGRLLIFESIEIEDGRPHRRDYAYQLEYRGEFLGSYHRDRRHIRGGLFHHKHVGASRRRKKWDRVTLHEMVDEMWDVVRKREAEEALITPATVEQPEAR
jgi:hypothetical protein